MNIENFKKNVKRLCSIFSTEHGSSMTDYKKKVGTIGLDFSIYVGGTVVYMKGMHVTISSDKTSLSKDTAEIYVTTDGSTSIYYTRAFNPCSSIMSVGAKRASANNRTNAIFADKVSIDMDVLSEEVHFQYSTLYEIPTHEELKAGFELMQYIYNDHPEIQTAIFNYKLHEEVL